MAEREPVIVIKKITVNGGGHHGGAWKVAFADFMTAMMAFFLVMWLLAQSDETKKNVADYFSTPSIIEYNFSNYGVELTLEKLFLDLINEPLKFFEQFIKPVDKTPNIMAMGSKRIVMHHMADLLSDVASNVQVNSDTIDFEIDARHLFLPGTSKPSSTFIPVLQNIMGLTAGLEDSNLFIESVVFPESSENRSSIDAKNIGERRIDILIKEIEATMENETVDIYAKSSLKDLDSEKGARQSIMGGGVAPGIIKFRVRQKEFLSNGKKFRKLDDAFGKPDENMDVYQNFVDQLTKSTRTK